MIKGVVSIVIISILLGSILVIPVSSEATIIVTSGSTLYVGGSGPGNYTKIQYAIDNATSGDTVFVYSGTYYENVVVDKSIELIGENNENTIIDGSEKTNVIKVIVDNVKIFGFTIKNSRKEKYNDAGIYCNSKNNIFSHNLIYENQNGLFIEDVNSESYIDANNYVANNKIIKNNKCGLYLAGISKNTVSNNNISLNPTGISASEGRKNIFEKNIIKNNVEGLDLRGYSYLIMDNIISNNSQGIHLLGEDCEFFNNIISKNSKGVYVHGDVNNKFENNCFINNTCGIHLQGVAGHQPYASRNIIIKNNFINNSNHAYTFNFQIWFRNYWDDWNGLDYHFYSFSPYWLSKIFPYPNVDLLPAKEPYDIDDWGKI